MRLTIDQVQHALDNLNNQQPFMNEYAYQRIKEVLEQLLKDLSKPKEKQR